MGVVLARASMSPIVYEVLDFACGITDASAQVIAQTNGLTLFTGTFGPQVQSVVEKFGVDNLHEGDVFATNISYDSGTHTSDVCLIKPIFFESKIVGFGVSVTHWIEIGGAVAGSIPPDATEIYQEGLRLPGIRVVEAGETSETVLDIIEANIRLPITGIGDLNAGLAAVGIAERRVVEACERYGVELVDATFEHILEHGERVARAALREIPNGVYTAEDVIDGDGITDDAIPIKVTVTIDDESLHADFTGSAPQTRGPINCSAGALLSACKTVVRAITDSAAAPASDVGLGEYEELARVSLSSDQVRSRQAHIAARPQPVRDDGRERFPEEIVGTRRRLVVPTRWRRCLGAKDRARRTCDR